VSGLDVVVVVGGAVVVVTVVLVVDAEVVTASEAGPAVRAPDEHAASASTAKAAQRCRRRMITWRG
jgi:hypothetical protein